MGEGEGDKGLEKEQYIHVIVRVSRVWVDSRVKAQSGAPHLKISEVDQFEG